MKKCCFCNEEENLVLGHHVKNRFICDCLELIHTCTHCYTSYIIADEFLSPSERSDLLFEDYCRTGFNFFKKFIPLANVLYVLINYKDEKNYAIIKSKFEHKHNESLVYKENKSFKSISIKEIILNNFKKIEYVKVEKSDE